MAIYKMVGNKEKLDKISATSFGQEGVLERSDLQRILRDQPEVLEKRLLIISEEFGNWQDSNRRIDLLALDADGRLVVIELKRGDTGSHMDLQAIRYAAMVANMTFEQVVVNCQAYLEKRAKEEGKAVEEDAAESLIREHLEIKEEGYQDIFTDVPRIILASENFGKELTTCVMWLNDSWLRSAGQEIKCIRLQPYRNGDEILVETSVIVPLPEAADYQTQIGQLKQEAREQSSGKVQRTQGTDAFEVSIGQAQEKFQPGLQRLYDAAVNMERENLAELSTFVNGKEDYVRLELRVPGSDRSLVWFGNLLHKGGRGGEISVLPDLQDIAINSLSGIDRLIGPSTSKSGFRHRRLSRIKEEDLDPILATIHAAYREANRIEIETETPAAVPEGQPARGTSNGHLQDGGKQREVGQD